MAFLIDEVDNAIRAAGRSRRTIVIWYDNSSDPDDKEFGRETEPYEIKDGFYWAWDVKKNDHIRRFKLDEIKAAFPTQNTFTPRWEVKL
jgi:predicted DNA-binding transcriptional regulator YafY